MPPPANYQSGLTKTESQKPTDHKIKTQGPKRLLTYQQSITQTLSLRLKAEILVILVYSVELYASFWFD